MFSSLRGEAAGDSLVISSKKKKKKKKRNIFFKFLEMTNFLFRHYFAKQRLIVALSLAEAETLRRLVHAGGLLVQVRECLVVFVCVFVCVCVCARAMCLWCAAYVLMCLHSTRVMSLLLVLSVSHLHCERLTAVSLIARQTLSLR